MYEYRCEVCGCFLDPGAGRVCEECLAEQRRRPVGALEDFLTAEFPERLEHVEDMR